LLVRKNSEIAVRDWASGTSGGADIRSTEFLSERALVVTGRKV